MAPVKAPAKGRPDESIVTLGTDVLTPGEAVTTCLQQANTYQLHFSSMLVLL